MRYSLLFVSIFIAVKCLSQSNLDGFVPTGTLHLKSNVYMDITEVTNISWQEFEYYIQRDSLSRYHGLIEPSQIITKNYRDGYYRLPQYRHHPVVGISWEQASAYCEWRSAMVNLQLSEAYKLGSFTEAFEVKYRLPTEEEWEIAARQADSLKFQQPGKYFIEDYLKKEQFPALSELLASQELLTLRKVKLALKEHRRLDSISVFKLQRPYPWFSIAEDKLPADVHFPQDEFYYRHKKSDRFLNMIGNVAELIQTKGIVKGGSWRHELPVSFPSKRIEINPTLVYDWVGFRCACEVLINKNPD